MRTYITLPETFDPHDPDLIARTDGRRGNASFALAVRALDFSSHEGHDECQDRTIASNQRL